MSGRKTTFLLFLIVLVALFFRVYDIKNTPPGLYGDEAMNGNNAKEALATGDYKVFYEENNGREGLFINIQAIFLKAAEAIKGEAVNDPWILRFPSALFGTLTVLGVYFLTKELFGDQELGMRNKEQADANHNSLSIIHNSTKIALFAAFLLAVSFWHVNFSRIGFRAIMAPAFLTWGTYLLLRSFRNSKLEIRNWPLPVLAGLVYGLGMYSYIAYRATPLLILIVSWLSWTESRKQNRPKEFLLSIFYFLISAVAVTLPLGIYFLNHPGDFFGRTAEISILNSPSPLKTLGLNILKTAGMFNFAGDWNPRHNIPGKPLLFWPVGILFLIGLILAIINAFKNPKSEASNSDQIQNPNFGFRILLSWLIITALPVVVSNEGLPHALRSILMAPAVFIIAALGGVWLYEKLSPMGRPIGPIRLIGLMGFIGLITINAYQTYFFDWAKRADVAEAFNAKYVEIAKEINALPAATAKYLIIDTAGGDVRKIGSPAQTIMFLTDTYLPEKQKEKNIRFIKPEEILGVPSGSFVFQL